MVDKSIDELYCTGHIEPILNKCKNCPVNKYNSECRFFKPINLPPTKSISASFGKSSFSGGENYSPQTKPLKSHRENIDRCGDDFSGKDKPVDTHYRKPRPDNPQPPRPKPQEPQFQYWANMQLWEED